MTTNVHQEWFIFVPKKKKNVHWRMNLRKEHGRVWLKIFKRKKKTCGLKDQWTETVVLNKVIRLLSQLCDIDGRSVLQSLHRLFVHYLPPGPVRAGARRRCFFPVGFLPGWLVGWSYSGHYIPAIPAIPIESAKPSRHQLVPQGSSQ